jgi:hypothetical protein
MRKGNERKKPIARNGFRDLEIAFLFTTFAKYKRKIASTPIRNAMIMLRTILLV